MSRRRGCFTSRHRMRTDATRKSARFCCCGDEDKDEVAVVVVVRVYSHHRHGRSLK